MIKATVTYSDGVSEWLRVGDFTTLFAYLKDRNIQKLDAAEEGFENAEDHSGRS